jgi:hypothetical protein
LESTPTLPLGAGPFPAGIGLPGGKDLAGAPAPPACGAGLACDAGLACGTGLACDAGLGFGEAPPAWLTGCAGTGLAEGLEVASFGFAPGVAAEGELAGNLGGALEGALGGGLGEPMNQIVTMCLEQIS